MVYISTTTIIGNIQAFSIEYVQKIYNLNINQLLSFSFKNSISFMFGDQIYEKFLPHTAGDFGWFIFFYTMGLFGVVIYFILIFSFYQGGRQLIPVLLLLLIGSSHYPSAFVPAGQIILAMILSIGPRYYIPRKISNSDF